jgi:hypothetical protein
MPLRLPYSNINLLTRDRQLSNKIKRKIKKEIKSRKEIKGGKEWTKREIK